MTLSMLEQIARIAREGVIQSQGLPAGVQAEHCILRLEVIAKLAEIELNLVRSCENKQAEVKKRLAGTSFPD